MRPSPAVALAALLALGALAWNLGGYALLEPDEGRNAEVMRELGSHGPWWQPTINGLPYVDKPIVHFAVGAVSLRAFGRTETAARLPSLLFTLATVALVGWFAGRTIGPEGGWLAAIATAATPFSVAYARTVIFDATLTFFVTLALLSFYVATEPDEPAERTAGWSLVAWAAIGLGVLTKGPVALAVPLLVAVPYGIWRRRLIRVLDPAGMLVLLFIVLPWVVAMSTVVPDFARYVVLVETAQRLGTDVLGRTEPWWYFLPMLPAAVLPWSAVLLVAIPGAARAVRERARPSRHVVLAALWIVLPAMLFSLSRSKRPQYLLPLVPPTALLVASWWQARPDRLRGARGAGTALLAIGAAFLLVGSLLPQWFATRPAVAAVIPSTAMAMGGVTLVAGAVAWALHARGRWALPALVLPVAAIPFVGMPLMRAIGDDRSSREVAEALAPLITAETEIVGVRVYPLSLPFYLDRTITLATDSGRELTSNYVARHAERLRGSPGTTLRPGDWWLDAWATCERPRIFLVSADDADAGRRLAGGLPLLAASRKFLAYGPCGSGMLAGAP